MCTSCEHKLEAKDLIPIISWVSLKGRCRYCGEKISARYTIVEVIGGISAVLCTVFIGINLWALMAFVISGVVVVTGYIIYDKVRNKEPEKVG
jgi:leader peptidase (prepilin peptidase)/N-methyltransferase